VEPVFDRILAESSLLILIVQGGTVAEAIWQGIVTNWFWWVLALVGSLLLSKLQQRRPKWVNPQRYLFGIAGLILLFLLYWKTPPRITPENIQTHVARWAERFRLNPRSVSLEEAHFTFDITLKSGLSIRIMRLKASENYLSLISKFGLTPDEKTFLEKLAPHILPRVKKVLAQELARAKIAYFLQDFPSYVAVHRLLPVTSNFSEADFIKGIDEIESAMTLARLTMELELERTSTK